jgi:predicted transcriptional regulator
MRSTSTEPAATFADGRRTYQQVADRFGVTRAAVCQYLAIIKRLSH